MGLLGRGGDGEPSLLVLADLEQVEIGAETAAAGGALEGGGVVAERLEVGERTGARGGLQQREVHLEHPDRGGDQVRQGQREQAPHLAQHLLEVQQPLPADGGEGAA